MMREINDVSFVIPEDEAALRIAALWQAYGNRPFCRFWQGEKGGLLAVTEGTAYARMGEDGEEIALFCTMSPDVRRVRTDGASAAALAARWGTSCMRGRVMRAEGFIFPTGQAEELAPSAYYPLMARVFDGLPPFDSWYADVHHRLRRGLFAGAAVREGEIPVSCAVTTAACDKAALIGGVATLPEYRGKGYASRCVTALAARLQSEGRRVWISPKNEEAAALYLRLGFTPCGEWGVAEK